MSGDRTGLETRKSLVDNVLRREKRRVLSRRGSLSGSLFLSRTFPRPTGLQPTPRVRAPGVLRFTPFLATTYDDAPPRESSLFFAQSAAATPPGRSSVQNSLALSSMGPFGLTTRSLWTPEGTGREMGPSS